MKTILLGRNGQLGRELQTTLPRLGEMHAFDSNELDVRDSGLLERTIRELRPDAIVNAAAYTDVDRAESEAEAAMLVNAKAPGVMAAAGRQVGASLIHFSTDYVFDGEKGSAYQEEDAPNPLNVYGKSKLAGEQAVREAGVDHLVLRTSWVYSMAGDNFVTRVLGWARRQERINVVSDQVGSPTWARALAEATTAILARGREFVRTHAGLYHLACEGGASRYAWAKRVLELDPQRAEQVVREILPVSSAVFPSAARRPAFSVLDCSRAVRSLGVELPNWMAALETALTGPNAG